MDYYYRLDSFDIVSEDCEREIDTFINQRGVPPPGRNAVTNARKVRPVNRTVAVAGVVLVVAVLARMLATGTAPLAGRFLVSGAGVAAGYTLVRLASGKIAPPRTPRGRFLWTAAMALLACSSVLASAAVGEGLYAPTNAMPAELLADGFLFGTFLGAMARLFAPPTEGEGS